MPDIHNWLTDSIAPVNTASRAASAWRLIQRSPQTLILRRNGSDLSAQTVRVEVNNPVNSGRDGQLAMQQVVIFGVRAHSDPTVVDSDLQRGDRFVLHDKTWTIDIVNRLPGAIQAIAEASTA